MIVKLNPQDPDISQKIRVVFQSSYAVEAQLLGVADFPPLKRPLESYMQSPHSFYAYVKKEEIAGIVEIEAHPDATDIHSLVVHPDFFRQGIASALLDFVLDTVKSNCFIVETGVKNDPAIALYRKFGFREVRQWDTEIGIRKIRFEKSITRA